MDRDENLKNAIKEGEVYRYFEWQITDPEDPFAFASDDGKEFYLNRRNAVQQKYGITIQYVAATANWTNDFAAAAYATRLLPRFTMQAVRLQYIQIIIFRVTPAAF